MHIIRENPQAVSIVYPSLRGRILPVEEDIIAYFCEGHTDMPDNILNSAPLLNRNLDYRVFSRVLVIGKSA